MNRPKPYPAGPLPGAPGSEYPRPAGMRTCGSCISRREAAARGCTPSAQAPGGKADAKPATQRARSRTQLKIPPIGANAPASSKEAGAFAPMGGIFSCVRDLGPGRPARRLELLGLEPAAHHAERVQQAIADVVRVRRARDGSDNPA